MTPDDFIDVLRRRVASAAVTPSAVRNMGASGVVEAARAFLTDKVGLSEMPLSGEGFPELLNRRTDELVAALPEGARHWGVARKVLNIFLRDAAYCFLLRQAFHLDELMTRLEVPVDHDVVKFLRDETPAHLPRLISIKSLSCKQNKQYQDAAKWIAKRKGIEPVDVDVLAWRKMSRRRESAR